MMLKRGSSAAVLLTLMELQSWSCRVSDAFSSTIPFRPKTVSTTSSTSTIIPKMSSNGNGEGSDSEWVKALLNNSGPSMNFDAELQSNKLSGLSGSNRKQTQDKFTVNAQLIEWLQTNDVYLSEASGWGEAPHPMAISTDTVDEITNESSGRGLLARRDINMEEELLKIPLSVCLTKQSARKLFNDHPSLKSNTFTGMEIIDLGMNDYFAIALQLIHEKFVLGSKSFYYPYMNILPNVNEVNPTFTWSDDDLAFLQGSPVISATKSLKAKLKREYDDLLFGIRDESIVGKGFGHAGLCNMYPNLFPKEHYTYQNWEWAFTMLFSRAIRLRNMKAGETLALVPYADLINHSPYSSSYLDARETGDWLFKTGGEEVILYADRGYKRMEQIYISYGQKSNADLLLLYGFALERNPFNSVDVTVSIANTLLETDPLADEKRTFLQKVGRGYTVDFPCYADRYPTEMLEYLRLIMMTPEDTRGKSLTDFNYSRTVSAANEASVLYSIISAIQTQLSRYPNTEEQDAEIIKDKALFRLLSYNQRMAVRHRRNEKRLLKRTIAALEKQIVSRGLDGSDLARAEGSTIGTILPGERKGAGKKERSDLEDRLDRMGLPVDLR